jgi:hypothetical protein
MPLTLIRSRHVCPRLAPLPRSLTLLQLRTPPPTARRSPSRTLGGSQANSLNSCVWLGVVVASSLVPGGPSLSASKSSSAMNIFKKKVDPKGACAYPLSNSSVWALGMGALRDSGFRFGGDLMLGNGDLGCSITLGVRSSLDFCPYCLFGFLSSVCYLQRLSRQARGKW